MVVIVRIVDPSHASVCLNGLLLVMALPVLLLPSLAVWGLPLGFALAPIIARERYYRRWELLRATPYTIEELLIGKIRGALWEMRGLFIRLGELQMQVLAAIILCVSLVQAWFLAQHWLGELGAGEQSALCVGVLLMPLGVLGLFFLDRVQQLTLMIMAGVTVSTSSRATHTSVVGTVTAILLGWGLDTGVAVAVLLLLPGGYVHDIKYNVAAIVMFGPIGGYAIALPLLTVACVMAVTVVAREIMIRVLWRWSLYNARRLD